MGRCSGGVAAGAAQPPATVLANLRFAGTTELPDEKRRHPELVEGSVQPLKIRRMRRFYLLILVGAALSVGILTALAIGQYAFGTFLWPIVLGKAVAEYYRFWFLFACAAAWLFLFFCKDKMKRSSLNFAVVGAACFSFLLLALFAERAWSWHELIVAKEYSSLIASQLEDYMKEHGHYPDTLNDIPNLPQPPRLLSYWRNQDGFEFSYPDPRGGFFSAYGYSSNSHRWEWMD